MQIEFNISRDMEEKRKRGREIEGKMGRRIDKIEKTGQSFIDEVVHQVCMEKGKRKRKR